MNHQDNRAAYIAGLRKLADLLDQHPGLTLPTEGTLAPMLWIERHDEVRERAQAFIRAVPGTIDKRVRDDYLELSGAIEGLKVKLVASRDDVCERVVIGQREVTREVPDPDVEVPLVTVTETEDIVEWRCAPVLGGASS